MLVLYAPCDTVGFHTILNPAGRSSLTLTAVAVDGPRFLTLIVQVTVPFGLTVALETSLVTCISDTGVQLKLAVSVLLLVLVSVGLLVIKETVLTIVPLQADAHTVVVIVIVTS